MKSAADGYSKALMMIPIYAVNVKRELQLKNSDINIWIVANRDNKQKKVKND